MLEDDIFRKIQDNSYDSVTVSITPKAIKVYGKRNSDNHMEPFCSYDLDDVGIACACDMATMITEAIYYQKAEQ